MKIWIGIFFKDSNKNKSGQLVIGGYDEENNHIVGGEVCPSAFHKYPNIQQWNWAINNKTNKTVCLFIFLQVFPPVHTCSNSIPDLQRPRAEHSMSVLPGGVVVVCGGLTPDTKQSTRPVNAMNNPSHEHHTNCCVQLDTCETFLTANGTEWTLFANMR